MTSRVLDIEGRLPELLDIEARVTAMEQQVRQLWGKGVTSSSMCVVTIRVHVEEVISDVPFVTAPLSGADVTATVTVNSAVFTAVTNASGDATVTVEQPSAYSEIKIVVSKTGYVELGEGYFSPISTFCGGDVEVEGFTRAE